MSDNKTYVVTAPYVTVRVDTDGGTRLLGYYRGATLPDGVTEASLQHHLDRDMIEEQGAAEKVLRSEPDEVTNATGSEPALYGELGTGMPGETIGTDQPAKSGQKSGDQKSTDEKQSDKRASTPDPRSSRSNKAE
jgi:hypothetical protein